MINSLLRLIPLALVLCLGNALAAEVERIALHQLNSAQVEHQRHGGNARAQAQRQGWIVRVPQLFVYLGDRSPAFHIDRYRPGFLRELNWVVERSRTERSTVRLDRLLANTETPEGEPFGLDDLPDADLYLLFYRRADCEECEALLADLEPWIEGLENWQVVWLEIAMDRVL